MRKKIPNKNKQQQKNKTNKKKTVVLNTYNRLLDQFSPSLLWQHTHQRWLTGWKSGSVLSCRSCGSRCGSCCDSGNCFFFLFSSSSNKVTNNNSEFWLFSSNEWFLVMLETLSQRPILHLPAVTDDETGKFCCVLLCEASCSKSEAYWCILSKIILKVRSEHLSEKLTSPLSSL